MAGGIKQWPEDERPREKLLKRGPEVLTDAELLALILRTGDAVSGKSAKLRGVEGARVMLDAVAIAGFAGAAALDGQGQFVGMVDVMSASVGGPANAAPQAALVPAATIRNFLETAGVSPLIGRSTADGAKAAIVRVICVRK